MEDVLLPLQTGRSPDERGAVIYREGERVQDAGRFHEMHGERLESLPEAAIFGTRLHTGDDVTAHGAGAGQHVIREPPLERIAQKITRSLCGCPWALPSESGTNHARTIDTFFKSPPGGFNTGTASAETGPVDPTTPSSAPAIPSSSGDGGEFQMSESGEFEMSLTDSLRCSSSHSSCS